MRELSISMAMINQVDLYHLQRRNGSKAIGAAGLVGCFGGKVEDNESAKEAIARELPEETNLTISLADLRQLESFDVESDHQLEPVRVHVKVFEVLLPYGQKVVAKEGELVSWDTEEIKANEAELTPATKEFFKRYFS
jgi:8-oxo-dGTP pyrophosphatase MutT (NUDIX family)